MEELTYIATKYYQNTVKLSFFGLKGGSALLLSIVPIAYILHLLDKQISQNLPISDVLLIVLYIIIGLFWIYAKEQYEKRLVRHLSFFTHSDSKKVYIHKAIYLKYLTSHIGDDLFETFNKFKFVIKSNSESKLLTFGNSWNYFLGFLYEPESKSRIISLIIYFISMIGLIIIIKTDFQIDYFFSLLKSFKLEHLQTYLILSGFLILIGYGILIFLLTFIFSFIVIPILMLFSSTQLQLRYLISELNKHVFLDIENNAE